jgi:hypothetical protein
MTAMTKVHPRWEEFLDRLVSPEGCDLRQSSDGRLASKCSSEPDKKFARRILKRMGLTKEDIEASCAYFDAFGGHCDCEIYLNSPD